VTPRGVVFDLDGTLVHNMPIHEDAFFEFIDRHSLPRLTEQDRGRFEGRRNRDIFPDLFGRPLSEEEQEAFSGEKEALYRELSRGRLRPLPGLMALLDRLEAAHVPIAIATSAPADNVPHTLGELGLLRLLPRVVRSDEVPRGKPHPDVFLEAARRIGVPPETCVAFEDAPLGVLSARGAGMRVVGVTTSFSAAAFAEQSAPPDLCIADFTELRDGPGSWLGPQSAAGEDRVPRSEDPLDRDR
jgi:beta-phosphoglucomutase